MSELIRIKPVSSKSKLETLREFGHRAFVELGDDGKPLGYFVEARETAGFSSSKPTAGRRTAVTANTALVWAGKKFYTNKPNSVYAKIAEAAKEFAAIPTRRAELVEAIEKDSHDKYTENRVTNAISKLTVDGYLVIPG